jgi:quercetin 2,3-dioxygenase
MDPGAEWTLPPAQSTSNRSLYLFRGSDALVAGRSIKRGMRVRLRADTAVSLQAGDRECELLLLQGKPIDEPMVQHGPFVMNSAEEIHKAFSDYRRTGFGGWPWRRNDPVHGREDGRFAIHADGREEKPR